MASSRKPTPPTPSPGGATPTPGGSRRTGLEAIPPRTGSAAEQRAEISSEGSPPSARPSRPARRCRPPGGGTPRLHRPMVLPMQRGDARKPRKSLRERPTVLGPDGRRRPRGDRGPHRRRPCGRSEGRMTTALPIGGSVAFSSGPWPRPSGGCPGSPTRPRRESPVVPRGSSVAESAFVWARAASMTGLGFILA